MAPKNDLESSGLKSTPKLNETSPSKMKSKSKKARLAKKKLDGPFLCFDCLKIKGFYGTMEDQFPTEDKAQPHLNRHKEVPDAKAITMDKANKMLEKADIKGFHGTIEEQFPTEDKAQPHLNRHKEVPDAKAITMENAKKMLEKADVQP